jgi:hypothetical protein
MADAMSEFDPLKPVETVEPELNVSPSTKVVVKVVAAPVLGVEVQVIAVPKAVVPPADPSNSIM